MRALVLGKGGREHALCWSLAAGGADVFVMPGSGGIATVADTVAGDPLQTPQVLDAVRRLQVDLVVPGPEEPLVRGIAEDLRAQGIPVFGPDRQGAQIEASKAYAKTLMRAAGIPTAAASLCQDFGEVEQTLAVHPDRTVVKADGLAAGKGVIVAEDASGARRAARRLLGQYKSVLLEERLQGPEVSLIAICRGRDYRLLPFARDHKRLLSGDLGPNTGGMGAFAPVLDTSITAEECAERTIAPLLRLLDDRGMPYTGALYAGLILTERGPMVLEYNVRFGDPETEVLLPAISGSILPWLAGAAAGRLPAESPEVRRHALGVVLAASGYPEDPETGGMIDGIEAAQAGGALIFHAGTLKTEDGLWQVAGGRVLCVVGVGEAPQHARDRAYAATGTIRFPGAQWRDDIGQNRDR